VTEITAPRRAPDAHGTLFGHATHTGRTRSNNQDNYACDPAQGVWLVADGMGGHQSGELASAIALQAAVEALRAGYVLADAIQIAHDAVLAGQDLDTAGMGSTIVALRVAGGEYEIAWVGDSRAYRYDGELHQLTRDHSVVQELIAAGALDPELAATHPGRNIITQALGAGEPGSLKVGTARGEIGPGDRFLLCSDGLHGEIGDRQIEAILAAEADPQRAVDQLVSAALEAGGSDNVTVVLVAPSAAVPRETVTPTEPMVATAPDQASRAQPLRLRAFVVGLLIGALVAAALWWGLRP